MARPKILSNYPKEYYALFQMANERAVVIACDSEQAAHNLRNALYSFRSVLTKYGEERVATQARNVRLLVQDRNLTAEPIRSNHDGN